MKAQFKQKSFWILLIAFVVAVACALGGGLLSTPVAHADEPAIPTPAITEETAEVQALIEALPALDAQEREDNASVKYATFRLNKLRSVGYYRHEVTKAIKTSVEVNELPNKTDDERAEKRKWKKLVFRRNEETGAIKTTAEFNTLPENTEAEKAEKAKWKERNNQVSADPTNILHLEESEGQQLKLWIDAIDFNDGESSGNYDDGMVWVTQGRDYVDILTPAGKAKVTNLDKVDEFIANVRPKLREKNLANYTAAKVVEKQIADMSVLTVEDEANIAPVRAAYDALTTPQKANVLNYKLLRDAENKIAKWNNKTEPNKVTNVKYAGTRSSSYGVGKPFLTQEQWKSVSEQMTGYFPGSRATFVWIIGNLTNNGVRMNFPIPEARKEQKADLEKKHIYFQEGENQTDHEAILTYFDANNIDVILQVENGFADADLCMDIVMEQFKKHRSVVGFGYDIEWYMGNAADLGIAITDETAERWDKKLKGITDGANEKPYRLFLKHYNVNFFPKTYRGTNNDMFICDDGQGCGSADGSSFGRYDTDMGLYLGYLPIFASFAEYFKDNDVLYQTGYDADSNWIYGLDGESVIKELGTRLAELSAPGQNCGITWVDFSLRDAIEFEGDWVNKANTLGKVVNILNNRSNNKLGRRFANYGKEEEKGKGIYATLSDAMFLDRVNKFIAANPTVYAELKDAQKATIQKYQATAVDIRVDSMPATIKLKDVPTVAAIAEAYKALTAEQRAQMKSRAQLKTLQTQAKALESSFVEIDIDATKPVVAITGAITGKTGREYVFTFTATDKDDDGAEMTNPVTEVKVKKGDTDIVATDNKFTPSEVGDYVITITATDAAGNKTTETKTIAVQTEWTNPEVNITSSNAGTVGTQYSVTFTATDKDDDGKITPVNTVVIVRRAETGASVEVVDNKFTPTEAGQYVVYVAAKDAAGNRTIAVKTVAVRTEWTQPEVNITGADIGTVGDEYTVNFTATDKDDVGAVTPGWVTEVKVTKGNTDIPVADNKFTPTEAGDYVITVKVVDAAGNETTETKAVVVSNKPEAAAPVLTVNNSATGYAGEEITIEHTAIGCTVTKVEVKKGETEVTVANNKFTPTEAGDYVITVTAKDAAGKETTATKPISIKAVPVKKGCGSEIGAGSVIGASIALVLALGLITALKARSRKKSQ